jgi:hypothetical protein
MKMSRYDELPPCEVCGQVFDNVFEATDHLLEDNEPEFDPKFILPGGYSLMLGSLMRYFYHHADDPEKIRFSTQDVYATLFAAEQSVDNMRSIIEDTIVAVRMEHFDEELEKLLNEGKKND